MREAARPVIVALVRALEPLEGALSSRARLQLLIRELGWNFPLTDDLFQAADVATGFRKHFKEIQKPLKQLFEALRKLKLKKPGDEVFLEDAALQVQALIPLFESLNDAVRALVSDLRPLVEDVNKLIQSGRLIPAPLADTAFWTDVLLNLPEYLLIRYLKRYQGPLYAYIKLLGIIDSPEARLADEDRNIPPALALYRSLTPRECLYLVRLRDIARDPVGYLKQRYGWGTDTPFAHGPLLKALESLFVRIGLRARRLPLRSALVGKGELFDADNPAALSVQQLELPIFEGVSADGLRRAVFGLMLVPAPESPTSQVSGLFITNLSYGELELELDLGKSWTLTIGGELDSSGSVGLRFHPGRVFFDKSPVNGEAAIAVTGAPDEPWTLFGGSSGPALRLAGIELGVRFAGSAQDAELELFARTLGDGMRLAVAPSGGDPFVQALLGGADLESTFAAELRWSSRDGLTFSGGAGTAVEIPVQKAVGPIFIERVLLGLDVRNEALSATAAITASASLGPFLLVIDGIGFRSSLLLEGDRSRAIARFGEFALALEFKSPTGVGISIDAGVARGGGALFLDGEKGEYAGMLELEFASIQLTAIGILTTKMPDGSKGWSLFLSICAQFSPIQLGFGFTLNGVGGLVGVNRRLEAPVLQTGLRDGSLDAILFPKDVVKNATQILSLMSTAFPVSQGNFVFGPMAKIGWGTPSIVTLDLGVILSLPDPFQLAIIGQLEALLPKTKDETPAALQLRVDLLGLVDFAAGTLSIDASLRESTVVGLPVRGDMALRLRWTGQPYFLLSFGGFNPSFALPDYAPDDLDRLSIALKLSDEVRIDFQAYFAVTANTVQFGAHFLLYASLMGFIVEGRAGLDVLFQFNPFHFQTDLTFCISVCKGDWRLAAASLELRLDGPRPWKLDGSACFEFMGIETQLPIHEVMGKAVDTQAARIDVGETLLRPALEQADAWKPWSLEPTAAVRLRDVVPESGGVWVLPEGGVVIQQSVAPLGVKLEHYGQSEINGQTRFALTAPKLAGTPAGSEAEEDWFAPGQFLKLSDEEKLSAPSFERLECGIRFGHLDASSGVPRSLELDYEEIVWDPGGAPDLRLRRDRGSHLLSAEALEAAVSSPLERLRRARVGARRLGPVAVGAAVRVRPARFSVTSRATGKAGGEAKGVRYVEAREVLKRRGKSARDLQLTPDVGVTEGVG